MLLFFKCKWFDHFLLFFGNDKFQLIFILIRYDIRFSESLLNCNYNACLNAVKLKFYLIVNIAKKGLFQNLFLRITFKPVPLIEDLGAHTSTSFPSNITQWYFSFCPMHFSNLSQFFSSIFSSNVVLFFGQAFTSSTVCFVSWQISFCEND